MEYIRLYLQSPLFASMILKLRKDYENFSDLFIVLSFSHCQVSNIYIATLKSFPFTFGLCTFYY